METKKPTVSMERNCSKQGAEIYPAMIPKKRYYMSKEDEKALYNQDFDHRRSIYSPLYVFNMLQ